MRRVGQLPVSGSIPFHFLSRAHKKGLVILALRVRRDRCRAESTLEVKSYDNDNELDYGFDGFFFCVFHGVLIIKVNDVSSGCVRDAFG